MMNTESKSLLAAAVAAQIHREPAIRIFKHWAKKCGIDWEDLRQAVMIKLLECIEHADAEDAESAKSRSKLPNLLEGIDEPERWQRSAIVSKMICNCAIDMSRREPAGKMRRIGERRRSARLVSGDGETKMTSVRTVQPLDSKQFFVEISRKDEAIPQFIVEDVFRILPVSSQQVLSLRFFEGLTFPEIAARTERSLEQIKSRWRSDIEELRPVIVKGWL